MISLHDLEQWLGTPLFLVPCRPGTKMPVVKYTQETLQGTARPASSRITLICLPPRNIIPPLTLVPETHITPLFFSGKWLYLGQGCVCVVYVCAVPSLYFKTRVLL